MAEGIVLPTPASLDKLVGRQLEAVLALDALDAQAAKLAVLGANMEHITLLGIALFICSGTAAADTLDDYIRTQMALSHIPGAAIAVVRDGRVNALRGYGTANLEWNIPAAPDTAFQLASATKLFTGIALMRLVERGELGLNDSIDRFFANAPADWRQITVQHLATHTSGLSDRLGEHPDTVEAVVTAAMKAPLEYAPGTQSRYGFTDFVVLRAILEKVSRRGLPALLQDEIVRPLGLQDTGFNYERQEGPIRSAVPLPRRATVHVWRNGEQRTSGFLYGETGYSAGGLFSSARDLAALFASLDRGELLKPESIRALQTPPALTNGEPADFGVGWTSRVYRGVKVAGHSGGPALADVLRADDRRLTIIVLTNQQRLYPLLAEGLADLYLPPPAPVTGLEDPHPELTATMVEALADAAIGKVDPARFGEAGRRDVLPILNEFGEVLLEAVGPISRVVLLEDNTRDGGRVRRYAIEFQRKRMFWTLTTDANGRIEDLHPVSER